MKAPFRCRYTCTSLLLAGALCLPAAASAETLQPSQAPKLTMPFSTATRAEVEASRRLLNEAIRQGAYRPPPPSNLAERLWARTRAWLGKRLGGLAVHTSGARWPARLLLALAFAGALIAPLLWWFHRARRVALLSDTVARNLPPQAWEQLRAEADALAGEGRRREAIHRLFWAVAARGEAVGLWRKDGTRTAREYLPLLKPGSASRETLAALLQLFERVWYGSESADEPLFREASRLADRLCTPGTLGTLGTI